VLESARWKSKLAIGEIVARLHPLPDVPTSVVPIQEFPVDPPPAPPSPSAPDSTPPSAAGVTPDAPPAIPPPPPARPTTLTPLSPQRYKLQVTISAETLGKLRRAKDLLGHVVAAGDDDAVFNRALTVLLDKLTREKCARTDKPRPGRRRHPRARRPCAAVTRIVWERDAGRCKYTSPDGHRCEETRRVVRHHSTRGCSPVLRTIPQRTSCGAKGTTTMKAGSTSVGAGARARTTAKSGSSRLRTARHHSAVNQFRNNDR
jgi:hypothetical protein